MSGIVSIGLASWIIQDGNYGDFKVNDAAAFALEFHPWVPLEVAEATPTSTSMEHVGGAEYEIVAQVIHATAKWWVIDAGLRLFCQQSPPGQAKPGTWLVGRVELGIDPFFYFESLALEPDAPASIYDWVIEAIEMQTAPLIEVQPRLLARDPSRLGWKSVRETRAWTDDGGHAEYLLRCRRRDGAPRHARTLR